MDDESLQLATRFLLYSVIGAIVIFFNAITILIYASDREYRRRFLLYEVLVFAELINGANFLTAGLGRYWQLLSGYLYSAIQSNECLFTMPWPILMIIGETYPASMTFLLSVERLCAITCLSEFRKNSHKTFVIILGAVYPLAMIGAASLTVTYAPQTNPTRICGTTASINPIYGLVQNLTTTVLYVVSLSISIGVYYVITTHRKCSDSEIHYMRTLLAFNGISCAFVAVPNILLIENNLGPIKFSDLFQGIVYSLYGIQSGAYFFVFYWFRIEFRRRFRRIIYGMLTSQVVSQITYSGGPSPPANACPRPLRKLKPVKTRKNSKVPQVLVAVVSKNRKNPPNPPEQELKIGE